MNILQDPKNATMIFTNCTIVEKHTKMHFSAGMSRDNKRPLCVFTFIDNTITLEFYDNNIINPGGAGAPLIVFASANLDTENITHVLVPLMGATIYRIVARPTMFGRDFVQHTSGNASLYNTLTELVHRNSQDTLKLSLSANGSSYDFEIVLPNGQTTSAFATVDCIPNQKWTIIMHDAHEHYPPFSMEPFDDAVRCKLLCPFMCDWAVNLARNYDRRIPSRFFSFSQIDPWDAIHRLTCILERRLSDSSPPTTS